MSFIILHHYMNNNSNDFVYGKPLDPKWMWFILIIIIIAIVMILNLIFLEMNVINKNRKGLLYAALILAVLLLVAIGCQVSEEGSDTGVRADSIMVDTVMLDTVFIDSVRAAQDTAATDSL